MCIPDSLFHDQDVLFRGSCSFRIGYNGINLDQGISRQSGYTYHSSCGNTTGEECCVGFAHGSNIADISDGNIDLYHITHGVIDTFHNCLEVVQALCSLLFYAASHLVTRFRVQR